MKSPTEKRQADILLQVCSFNDKPKDKWLAFFKESEIKWLLDTDKGQKALGYDPVNQIEIEETLRDFLEKGESGTTEAPESRPEEVLLETPTTVQVSREKPVQRHTEAVTGTPHGMIITTDKGEFYNTKLLCKRLEPLYRIDDFEQVFNQAMVDIDVDPSVDYLSTVKRKALIKKLKTLVKEYLDKVTEEACNG